jgi:flavin reductase (DIM6/NTAB) family NADH-FMN oxidoreductase RutF/rubredoxin
MVNYEALFKVTYGLYIVCSGDEKLGNGFISNTVFQVSSDPVKFAVCCSKNNYTAEFIRNTGAFSVSVLEQNASSEIVSRFGFKTGKESDKISSLNVKYGTTGVPVVLNESIAYFELKLVQTIDTGTHLLFIGQLENAEILDDTKEPLTYLHYRQVKKGFAPKNAPTYVDKAKLKKPAVEVQPKKFKCPVCGYVYDESDESIRFADLPADWVCPVCGTPKSEFSEME